MGMGISFKAVGTLVELAIPWILSYIIDDLIPLKEIRPVCLWGGLMIVCSLIAWGGNITANRMASAVARDCTRQIRHDLFQKISYLSESRVDAFTIPSLISRMTSDTYVLHQTVGMIQRIGIRAPLLLFGGHHRILDDGPDADAHYGGVLAHCGRNCVLRLAKRCEAF